MAENKMEQDIMCGILSGYRCKNCGSVNVELECDTNYYVKCEDCGHYVVGKNAKEALKNWEHGKDGNEHDSGEYELKPCQCGSDVELCRGDDDYYIYCPKCKLKTFSDRVYDNITDNCDRLIKAWNRRADDGNDSKRADT